MAEPSVSRDGEEGALAVSTPASPSRPQGQEGKP